MYSQNPANLAGLPEIPLFGETSTYALMETTAFDDKTDSPSPVKYRLLSAELGRSHFYQFAELAVEGAHCLEARRSGNVFDCVVRVVRKQEQVHGMTDAQAEKIILQGQSCGTPHSGGEITLVCAKSFNQVVTLEVVVEVRLFFLQIGFELFKQVVAIAGLQVTDEVAHIGFERWLGQFPILFDDKTA